MTQTPQISAEQVEALKAGLLRLTAKGDALIAWIEKRTFGEAPRDIAAWQKEKDAIFRIALAASPALPVQEPDHIGDANEMVEPVQKMHELEPVAWGEEIDGNIVSVRIDKSRHCTTPLYASPNQALEAALTRIAAIKYPAVETIYAHRAIIDYARNQARAALVKP